jgi:hypothetical protein
VDLVAREDRAARRARLKAWHAAQEIPVREALADLHREVLKASTSAAQAPGDPEVPEALVLPWQVEGHGPWDRELRADLDRVADRGRPGLRMAAPNGDHAKLGDGKATDREAPAVQVLDRR